jgi:hypothetical protein
MLLAETPAAFADRASVFSLPAFSAFALSPPGMSRRMSRRSAIRADLPVRPRK